MYRRQAVIVGIVLATLWLWVSFGRPYTTDKVWEIYSGQVNDRPVVSKDIDVFDFSPLKSWVIQDVCESTKWNSSLVFTCDNNHGGVGHVRNGILNCVRYAIAAGASLVLPNIALREDEMWQMEEMVPAKEKRHGPGRRGLEYMFDKEHFVHSLRHSCPQLNLINDMEQTSGGRRRALLPESLVKNHPTTGLEHPEKWPELFFNWVEGIIPHYPQNEQIVVDLEQSFLEYPTHSDGHQFTHQFGNILKFRADVRRLATKTIQNLADWYNLDLNISHPIIHNSYFAAHLRTEDPMIGVEGLGRRHGDVVYSHYNAQAKTYLAHAEESKMSLIYVASGNLSEVHRFAMEAAERGVSITHKEDLLKGKDMEELDRLRWDQRALVDYLVVLKTEQFTGVGHSSFSWNVVLKRHEAAAEGRKGILQGDQPDGVWSDGISHLYGVRKGYVESSRCMWP